MNDVFRPNDLESFGKLLHPPPSHFFCDRPMFLDELREVAALAEFKNQVDVVVGLLHVNEFYDVGTAYSSLTNDFLV